MRTHATGLFGWPVFILFESWISSVAGSLHHCSFEGLCGCTGAHARGRMPLFLRPQGTDSWKCPTAVPRRQAAESSTESRRVAQDRGEVLGVCIVRGFQRLAVHFRPKAQSRKMCNELNGAVGNTNGIPFWGRCTTHFTSF